MDRKKLGVVGGVLTVAILTCILTLIHTTLSGGRLALDSTLQIESAEDTEQFTSVNQKTKRVNGIDSPYKYDCSTVKCTALDEYVWRDNEHFSYEQVAEYGSLVGPRPVKTFVLNMTSQHWLTENEVDRPVWYHDLLITLPKTVDGDLNKSCLFLIDKGSNKPNRIIKGVVDHLDLNMFTKAPLVTQLVHSLHRKTH